MTRVAFVDMVGGAAGDMLLGAWIDAGLDAGALERALRTVVRDGWELVTERVVRRGIAATYADLVIPGEDHRGHDEHGRHVHHQHRGHRLRDILDIVEHSGLSPLQRTRAGAVYRRIAEAEARVHGEPVDEVVFHEVGQIDAVLDVAGTCIALDMLEIDELRCSAFPAGHGSSHMHHGHYPNPSPGTAELLRGFPLRMVDVEAELVTVTGAAILTTLATTPGERVDVTLERVGYGAGRSDFPFPNVVRVLIGTTAGVRPGSDEVVIVEANIDDMSPQLYELALERLFAAGARDAWLTPIVMKKGRPAIVLSALAAPTDEAAVAETMLRETTTIGVRVRRERRYVLAREEGSVETPFGPVRVKRVAVDGVRRARAEYDDCARIARERALPLAEVLRVVEQSIAEEAPA